MKKCVFSVLKVWHQLWLFYSALFCIFCVWYYLKYELKYTNHQKINKIANKVLISILLIKNVKHILTTVKCKHCNIYSK